MIEKKHQKSNASIIVIILIAAIIILIVFLLSGKTTTTGNFPGNITEKSLSCSNNKMKYPFFSYDEATKRTTVINLVFSNDKLKAMHLIHNLYYNDTTAIKDSEAHNHAAMNNNFAKDGLGPDALNIIYSRLEDKMQTSLYIEIDDFDDVSLKYFLIDASKVEGQTLSEYEKEYISLGFTCKNNN